MAKKAALIILDGFGITPERNGNAVYLAKTPFIDSLIRSHPKCLLNTSGMEAGLPWGEFGNSEVGHTNIGLGRVVLQDLPQINKALEDLSINKKEMFREILEKIEEGSRTLHLITMASDGAVHGHIDHAIKIQAIVKAKIPQVKTHVHLISDGRDVGEKSINIYFEKFTHLEQAGAKISSISGRYYAMDRDKNLDRTQEAVDAILGKSNLMESNIKDAVSKAYERKETDEYIRPTKIGGFSVDLKNDVFIFTNYRADRAIQLTRALTEDSSEIKKDACIENFYMMTTYDDNLSAKSIFSNLDLNDEYKNSLTNPSPKIIADAGLKQFHVSETEKFAHVTYFFSGGIKDEFSGQTNKIIPSEKVKSYDLFPQMKAREIADEVIGSASSNDFIVANFANGDMVGHSGILNAAVNAVEVIDKELARTVPALLEKGFAVFIASDHGNCDEMIDAGSGRPSKEHSFNPVPFIFVTNDNRGNYIDAEELNSISPVGLLADVMPTILLEMGLETSPEMMGINLTKSMI